MIIKIRKAEKSDCRALADLSLMAGEGIPAFFWQQSQQPGQDVVEVGAIKVAAEEGNFSYQNAHVAEVEGEVAAMLLAYRLPDPDGFDDLNELPEFIRPLVELEQCVPGSFYINMLATYPQYRNQKLGSRLMAMVDQLAVDAGCDLISIEVFEENAGALRLYQRLGFETIERRPVVPHACHPYGGDIVLLVREALTGPRSLP